MTREDAIKELRELRKIGEIMTNEHYKAIDMAIKALEQCEVWNGIHGQVVAPKGTFDKIWEDADKAEQEQQTDIRDKRVNDELNRVKDELEQEPKTGHWIETNGTILNHRNQILHEVICSECCGIAYFRSIGNEYIGANLCPNCGSFNGGAKNGNE